MSSSCRANLDGEREAIAALLKLFTERGIAATWATVGFLFARTRAELETFRPLQLPSYADPRLNPYNEDIGADEKGDPLHYARQVIERIRGCPRQEIASHTFSHYYCLEPGQTLAREGPLALRPTSRSLKNGLSISR